MRRCVAAAALLLLVAGGCGDGGEALTADEYFAELDEIGFDYAAGVEGLRNLPAEDDEVAAARAAARAGADVFGRLVAGLELLDPPDEFSREHSRLVAAGREAVRVEERFLEEVGELGTIEDIEAAFSPGAEGHGAVLAAIDAFTAECVNLTDAATAQGREVYLWCWQAVTPP